MQFILLFLAIIPVVIILTYIYKKDKKKEPGGLLVTLFIMGIVSCFMVLAISDVMSMIFPFMNKATEYMTFFEIMAHAFIGVALVEEFCKFFMTYLFSYKHKSYDEVYDGIVYAVFVSLGFAFFENILYVLSNQSISVGIARGILAVPGHACDAVFMGYYLSVAKVYSHQRKKKLEHKNLILSVLAPTILHGIYDFCLFTGHFVFVILFLVFVVFMYIASIKKIKQLAGTNKSNNQRTNQHQNTQHVKAFNSQTIPKTVSATPNYTTPNPSLNNQSYVQNNGHVQNNNNDYFQPNNNDYFQPNNDCFQTNDNNGYVNLNKQPINKFCSTCGTPVKGNFCGKCGSRQS